MITFQWEKWTELSLEAVPLLAYYFNTEGVLYADIHPMDPDFETLAALERMGRLHVVTVRDDELLIGLNIFNCGGSLFRRQVITAAGLVLYLHPAYRNFLIARRFLRATEAGLKELGCQMMIYTPSSTVEIGPLLTYLKYDKIGGSYEKLL